MHIPATDHLGPKPVKSKASLELDVQEATYRALEAAREACKAADALGDGKVRLLCQGLLDSAYDANWAVSPEEKS